MLTMTKTEYEHMTFEDCAKRWPRLIRLMQWAAILSSSEAACALRDYRDARAAIGGDHPYSSMPSAWQLPDLIQWGEDMMRWGGGEAVSHYGGPRRLIGDAVRRRRDIAKLVRAYDR
jgi:hypothetical protein